MTKQLEESASGGEQLARRRMRAGVGLLACLLTLSACNTIYDYSYFRSGSPTPEHPVDVNWLDFRKPGHFDRDGYAKANRELENLRMGDLLLAYLRQEFPRDTTPNRLVAWLEWDGFRCERPPDRSGSGPGRIKCSMRRVMHVTDVLFGYDTAERLWVVDYG